MIAKCYCRLSLISRNSAFHPNKANLLKIQQEVLKSEGKIEKHFAAHLDGNLISEAF